MQSYRKQIEQTEQHLQVIPCTTLYVLLFFLFSSRCLVLALLSPPRILWPRFRSCTPPSPTSPPSTRGSTRRWRLKKLPIDSCTDLFTALLQCSRPRRVQENQLKQPLSRLYPGQVPFLLLLTPWCKQGTPSSAGWTMVKCFMYSCFYRSQAGPPTMPLGTAAPTATFGSLGTSLGAPASTPAFGAGNSTFGTGGGFVNPSNTTFGVGNSSTGGFGSNTSFGGGFGATSTFGAASPIAGNKRNKH